MELAEHKWTMVIDLSKCIGCKYCVRACQAVNDVADDMLWNVYVLDGHLGKLFRFTPKGVSDEMVNSSESGGPQALVTPVGIGEYKKRVYTLERIKGTVHRWDSRS